MSDQQSTNKGVKWTATATILAALIAASAVITVGYWQYRPMETLKEYRGRVVDTKTGKVIQRAKIILESQDTPTIIYSDSEGIFSFPLKTWSKQIRIRVEANGYKTYDRFVNPSNSLNIEEIQVQSIEESVGTEPVQTDSPVAAPTPSKTSTPLEKKSIQAPSLPLQTGTYLTQGSMYANFRREIVNVQDRVCIKIVDGPANNYEGYETITVSSLSWRENKFYIDAINKAISIDKFDGTSFRVGSTRELWELGNTIVTPSQEMNDCLETKERYTKIMYGKYIPGLFKSE